MDKLEAEKVIEDDDYEDIDDIDVINYRGIFVEEEAPEKYQDEVTGAHFEYNDLCNKLQNLIPVIENKKNDKKYVTIEMGKTIDSLGVIRKEGNFGSNRVSEMTHLLNNGKANSKENKLNPEIKLQIINALDINKTVDKIIDKNKIIINSKSSNMKKLNTRNENFFAKQLGLGTSESISNNYKKSMKVNNYITNQEKTHQTINKINDNGNNRPKKLVIQNKPNNASTNKLQNFCSQKKLNIKGMNNASEKQNINVKEINGIKKISDRNHKIFKSFKGNSELSGLSLFIGKGENIEISSALSPGTIHWIKSSICLAQKFNQQNSYPKRL